MFTFQNVPIVPHCTLADLPLWLGKPYSFYILDMGVINANTSAIFYRSDLCITIGSICPWKSKKYQDFVNALKNNYEHYLIHFIFLSNGGITRDLRSFYHDTHVKPESIPYIPDPFQLSSEQWSFFDRMLQRNIIYHTNHSSKRGSLR